VDGFIREIKLVSGARRRLERHFHDEYSLAFLHLGRSRARAWGRELPVKGGDLVLIPPRFPHACNPEEGSPWAYSLFALAPGWVERAAGWDGPPAGILRVPAASSRGWNQPRIAELKGDRAAMEALARDAVSAIARWRQEASPGASHGAPAGTVPEEIRSAREFIDAHLGEKLRLDDLAAAAGLSTCGFLRAFERATGMSPHAYILSARINRAKRQLTAGESPADAAFENGFCDQSHFSRAFALRAGVTPGRYPRP